MQNNDGSPRLRILLAIIAGVFVVIAAIIAAKCGRGDGPVPPKEISYAGRVINMKTEQSIKGAAVFIDTKGETQKYFTDNDGIYKVTLNADLNSFHLRVEATGFKVFDSYISPKSRDQLQDVRLEYLPDAFVVNLPDGLKLKAAIEFIAEQDQFGVEYVGKCDPRLLETQVKSGPYKGENAGNVIDQLKNRLKARSTNGSYQVTRITERKVYQIGCTN